MLNEVTNTILSILMIVAGITSTFEGEYSHSMMLLALACLLIRD